MKEKEKMLSGQLYYGNDELLVTERLQARRLCWELNNLDPVDLESQKRILTTLFGREFTGTITPPFYCDYGYNIQMSENVYFNFNCVILDGLKVTIGKNTLFGPSVQIYTASHPTSVDIRQAGMEFGKPVTIEDDVWVGGAAVICPGVSIGHGSIIGAGSIVTKDVPSGVLAAGNPCRVIKSL
jgi:maltose O-acetyltransferase